MAANAQQHHEQYDKDPFGTALFLYSADMLGTHPTADPPALRLVPLGI